MGWFLQFVWRDWLDRAGGRNSVRSEILRGAWGWARAADARGGQRSRRRCGRVGGVRGGNGLVSHIWLRGLRAAGDRARIRAMGGDLAGAGGDGNWGVWHVGILAVSGSHEAGGESETRFGQVTGRNGIGSGRVPVTDDSSRRLLPRGGRTAAILASLTSTSRRHDVDPQAHLTQLLVNLPAAPMSDLPAWLPDEWKRVQAPRPNRPPPA